MGAGLWLDAASVVVIICDHVVAAAQDFGLGADVNVAKRRSFPPAELQQCEARE